jgi:hypothetical protein
MPGGVLRSRSVTAWQQRRSASLESRHHARLRVPPLPANQAAAPRHPPRRASPPCSLSIDQAADQANTPALTKARRAPLGLSISLTAQKTS